MMSPVGIRDLFSKYLDDKIWRLFQQLIIYPTLHSAHKYIKVENGL